MDRLDSMRVLLAVVDAGSLSAAGRKLGMPLATVSRKVSELEAALHTRLLLRSTRQQSLTDSGRGYVAASRKILEDLNEAERDAAGEYRAPRGELVLTAPVVFGRLHVVPVVVEFLRAYPDVSVRLALGDRIVNLVDEHIDLALRIGTLPDSGMVATTIGSIRRIACASPAYLAEAGTPRHPRDLTLHRCVSFDALAAGSTWRFSVEGAESQVPIHPRLTVSTAEAAVDAAVAGLGVTCVLSYQAEAALRAGTLTRILPAFEPARAPVSLVYSSQGRLPLKLRALLDFAAPRLRAQLLDTEDAIAGGPPPADEAGTARKRR
jgi:DNA-binding transcriptional LysR family regulator